MGEAKRSNRNMRWIEGVKQQEDINEVLGIIDNVPMLDLQDAGLTLNDLTPRRLASSCVLIEGSVGVAIGTSFDNQTCGFGVVVVPGSRNQGWGHRMVEELSKCCRANENCAVKKLVVDTRSTQIIRFSKKLGFTTVARWRGNETLERDR